MWIFTCCFWGGVELRRKYTVYPAMWSRIVWRKCAICRHCADFAPVGSRKTCPSPLGRRRQGECQSGRSGLRPSPCAGGFPPQRPLKTRPHSTRCSQYPITAARRLLSTSKGYLRGPSWTDQIMIPHRFSSWSFVALRGQKEGVLPSPPWTDQIMIPHRFSSWPFVDKKKVFSPALRGKTKS